MTCQIYCGFYCCWLVFHLTPFTLTHTVYHSAASAAHCTAKPVGQRASRKPWMSLDVGSTGGANRVLDDGGKNRTNFFDICRLFTYMHTCCRHIYCMLYILCKMHPHVALKPHKTTETSEVQKFDTQPYIESSSTIVYITHTIYHVPCGTLVLSPPLL